MNADEIRTLYVETLARAQRAADLAHYPQRDDGTLREDWAAMSEWMRRMYLDAATPFVDALATAGLLPTEIEWGAGEVEDHSGDRVRTVPHDICKDEAAARADASLNGEPVMRRLAHDWREVSG